MKITVLASGSKGNCTIIQANGTVLLVDAGISASQVDQRIRSAGLNPSQIDGVLITHEHADHCEALNVWSKNHPLIPVYSNRLTASAIRKQAGSPNWRIFQTGSEFSIGDIDIKSFSIPHDALDPVGFIFHHNSRIAAVLTDLGHVDENVFSAIRDASFMVLESNYNLDMLKRRSDCPWVTKQRIASTHGHLDNNEAAKLVAGLSGNRLEQVVLAHLSTSSNTPELAMSQVLHHVNVPMKISCAQQRVATETFEV